MHSRSPAPPTSSEGPLRLAANGAVLGVAAHADLNLFRLLIEGVTDYAIFMLDPQGHVASWNSGAERIKGYRAEEIIGSHFSRFYTPRARATGWPDEELRRAKALGRFEDEGWRVRKDGSRFWANVVITALRAPDGEMLGFTKITRDLSERRAHEERLRESEERFRLLVEGVKDTAIVQLDAEGRVASWNAGAQRVKGHLTDEVLGRSFAVFYPPEDIAAGRPQRLLGVAAATGYAEDIGWRVRRDGSRFWAETTLTVLRHDSGSLRGFALVTRDISSRRRIEELEAEGKRLDEFVAMLGHELRNPLAVIRHAVELLGREGAPSLAWSRDLITRQAAHLGRLVDDLLDLGRVRSGHIALERERIELRDVVHKAVDSLRLLIEERGHELQLQLPERPIFAIGDPTRLAQVVVNLLGNAAKYTPHGGRIQVTLRQQHDTALLAVRDNGIGMSSELRERAFEPFVQGERTLNRPDGGLGIGLALVQRIVLLHGGTVEARSAGEGRGSEFVVTLPALEQSDVQQGPTAPSPRRSSGRDILVVDDNDDLSDSLAALLTLEGHHARVARNGDEALRLAAEQPPDLVLLDIGLPGMDGYEVARRMRQLPGLQRAQLIAMTGYGMDSDKRASTEAGFDAHLVKPLEYAVLAAMMEGPLGPR